MSTIEGPVDERVETLRRVLLDHHPVVRSETGPLAGCRCGQVQLGQDVIAHVAAQVLAALPPSPAEEAVKRVEALCDAQGDDSYVMTYALRAALASPAPAPHPLGRCGDPSCGGDW